MKSIITLVISCVIVLLVGVGINIYLVNDDIQLQNSRIDIMSNALTETIIALDVVGNDIQDIIDSTVMITDGMGHGSGVYLGDGIILTAWHCQSKPGSWIEDSKGNVYEILDEIIVGDFTEDIGFIKINPKADIPAMKNFGEMPNVGDIAYICGNPLDPILMCNFTTGTISKVDVDFPGWWDDAIISDAASYPGNSGGGVYNKDFELVGILVGGYTGTDNISIIEPIEDILRMMKLEL